MSHNDTQSLDHGRDDEQSRRWSTHTVASTSLGTCLDDEGTDSSHKITEKTLSGIPRSSNMLETRIASSVEADFHERQVSCANEETHLTTKHASAITVSLQQCSDIISRRRPQVDPQADMLAGLQMHMKPNPPAAFPADLRADLDVNHRPDPPAFPADLRADLDVNHRPDPPALPPIPIDEHYDDAEYNNPLESAYATAYQLRAPGVVKLDSEVADTMRREAAMDDAIFRPRFMLPRTPARELRRSGEYTYGPMIQRHVRKRKREEKDTD